MNDVPGAIGVLCGVLWNLTTPVVPALSMAWDALLHNIYLAADLTAAACVLFAYTLICPTSTLVCRLARHVNYFGHITALLSAAYLFVLGLYLFIAEYRLGLVLTVASPIIVNLSSLAAGSEADSDAMEDYDLSQREPDTAELSDKTSTTKTSDAHDGPPTKAAIWAYCRWIFNCANSLLLVSTLDFIASQFIVSIAVTSITTGPIFISDDRLELFKPQVLFEVNITEVAVATANATESKTRISTPVNTIPDFITVFGSPTQAVPTPAPVAKSIWAPAASSTPMPTPEPTPSKVPDPEPEPEPEPEPKPEPQEWIAPDEVFPVFEEMINKYISQAKATKEWWLDLETVAQSIVIATAAAVAWALLPVLGHVTAASTITATASYTSSLLFPILQEQGLTRDQALVLCISLALDMTMIATSTLYRLSRRRGQQSQPRINATVDNADQYTTIIGHGHPSSSSSSDNNHLKAYLPQLGGDQPEADDNVRMYIEGIVKEQATKLAQDVQLHAMITNAVLLALQGPDKMPTHAAAWNRVSQQMWCHFVQHTVAACLREQQQQQAHTNNPRTTDAPAEGSSGGHWARSSSPGDSLDAHPDARNNDGDSAFLLPEDTTEVISGTEGVAGLLPDRAPGAARSGGGGLPADHASEAGSREGGAPGIDVHGDEADDETTSNVGNNNDTGGPLSDLDYLGENGRILGEHLCRLFARLLQGDYPDRRPTRRGKKKSRKDRAEAAAKAQQQAESEAEQRVSSGPGSEEPVSPEHQGGPEQDGAHIPPSPGDGVNDINVALGQPEPAPTAAEEESKESKESSSDGQGGDNKDTPATSTPEQNGVVVASHSPDDNCAEPSASNIDSSNGEVPSIPTGIMDSQGGDNKDTPLPTPPPPVKKNKGLAGSRFADEDYTPAPITPVKDEAWAARFKKNMPPTSKGDDTSASQHRRGSSKDAEAASTSTGGGQHGDNKTTPLPAPPPVKKGKGLAGSRFADDSYTPVSIPPVKDGLWAARFGKETASPSSTGGEQGENKDSPVATTPVKKGLGNSRFANEAAPVKGSSGRNDNTTPHHRRRHGRGKRG
ncbi:hypothetical protein KVR01_007829 [Diaporthe batatas]|uniref:uncharacterized protein n=1 Tax=Diaporthe batatas TaxID=748121 RepID=UPI001D0385E7|nr:uncharacterized protein KVR01_007829 [Diaporthe batatas]KAG8162064.1 hypothetical protein KVR01_007829 [Diaporthe batatas]